MTACSEFYASVAGTILVALCCFTPILIVALAAVGVAAFTPYLDFVLLPSLGRVGLRDVEVVHTIRGNIRLA